MNFPFQIVANNTLVIFITEELVPLSINYFALFFSNINSIDIKLIQPQKLADFCVFQVESNKFLICKI